MIKGEKKPLVSVVITNYNYGKYVGEAIESVLGQTYDNVELIVIDDGSIDNSKEIIESYVGKGSELRFVYQENRGIVKTRNRAIDEVKGEYYIQLDADDCLDKDYVEEVLKLAVKDNLDLVYTDFQKFDKADAKSNFPADYRFEHLKNQNFIHISCLIKRSSIGEIRFDESLSGKSHEDWDFFLSLGVLGIKAAKCTKTVLNYRIHGEGRNIDDGDLGLQNQLRYVDVYSYIINKHSQGDERREFEYLIGPVFGSWLTNLHNQYIHIEDKVGQMQDEVAGLRRDLRQLRQSRSYKVGEAIAFPVRRLKTALRKKS